MIKKKIVINITLVIVLSLSLILLTTSVASAEEECYSQTWYLWESPQVLQKDDPNGGTYVPIAGYSSQIWISTEAAQGAVTFGEGDWPGDIGFHGGSPQQYNMFIEVGSSSDGADFTSEGSTTVTTGPGNFIIPDTGFTVPDGHYLAVRITNNYSTTINIQTGSGGSWISSPCSDPGYPLPELSSLILLSISLVLLIGYIYYKNHNTAKIR